jgi:ankyrin repeat protein
VHTHSLHNSMRHVAVALVAIAALSFVSGCSSSPPGSSPSAKPSASESAVAVASDVPLEEQLYDALRAGDVDLTTAVLAAGADVNAELAKDSTALSIAVVRNDPSLVGAVLAANPDLTVPEGGMPLLNAACRQGVSGEVVGLLLDAGAAIDAPSPDDVGSLAIHECAYSGSSDAIDVLLDHGVDVNARQNLYGATPLIVASWQGHADLVLHLIDVGADVSLTTNDGATARDWALVGGYDNVAELLANEGG